MSKVKVDIDPKAIDNFFGKLDTGLDDVADEVFAISQDLVPVDRATLKKSARVEREFLEKTVIYDSPEATWNEYGTEPHMPPEEPIIGWVRRNAALFGISSRSKTAIKKVANSIRWKIYNYGTDPSPFLRPAFDDVQARAKAIIWKYFR
jgi:hypothetical protein